MSHYVSITTTAIDSGITQTVRAAVMPCMSIQPGRATLQTEVNVL